MRLEKAQRDKEAKDKAEREAAEIQRQQEQVNREVQLKKEAQQKLEAEKIKEKLEREAQDKIPRENQVQVEPAVQSSQPESPRKFAPKSDKCGACGKTVYKMEELKISETEIFHKTCFRCAHCNNVIKLGNFAALSGKFYCKPHFKMLFQEKGNYSEGFGELKPQHQWEAKNSETSDASSDAAPSGSSSPPMVNSIPAMSTSPKNEKSDGTLRHLTKNRPKSTKRKSTVSDHRNLFASVKNLVSDEEMALRDQARHPSSPVSPSPASPIKHAASMSAMPRVPMPGMASPTKSPDMNPNSNPTSPSKPMGVAMMPGGFNPGAIKLKKSSAPNSPQKPANEPEQVDFRSVLKRSDTTPNLQ
eukprot:TRINITY_DN145_c0_g1_i15.p1 TRINITY_DN145_c0_g1~~TRINITY_DN145_c0_g1_i15.p1  ORF type:complete len:359 (-),score=154.64 TRINITY_DN145_c0_g1_i15:17-1093(-)